MTNIKTILKLLIKNDYKKMLIWIGSIFTLILFTSIAYPTVYETEQDIASFALIVANPAMKGLLGDIYPNATYNHALIFSQEILMMSAIFVAVMNVYFSVRFTRVFEDDGVIEIINSKPVERYTFLTSSIILILLMNLVLFILNTFGLVLADLNGATLKGNILYGLALFAIGLVYSGIGLLSSKLFNTASTSYTFSYLCLLIFYIVRAIGDVSIDQLTYFSPLGWVTKTQVFYKDNYLYIVFMLLLASILYFGSFYLFKKVDYGSGIFNLNKGKSNANKLLKTNIGLIINLQKVQVLVWALSIFLLTAAFGGIFHEFESFLEIELVKQFFGDNIVDFSSTIIYYIIKVVSIFGIIPALNIIFKLAKEEKTNSIENVYTRNSRSRYVLAHLITSFLTAFFMQVVILLGAFSTGSKFILDNMSFIDYLLANLIFLPAIWLVISFAVLLLGIGREHIKYTWFYFGFIFVAFYLEEILKLPKFIMSLSTIYHVDPSDINYLAAIIMVILSIVLSAVGIKLYKKRNLE